MDEESSATSKIDEGLRLLLEGLSETEGLFPPLSPAELSAAVEELGRLRGRPLFVSYLSSGFGRGARVRLADGRWVLDFALGIGVHFFGHGDPDMLRVAIRAALADTVMQGNLQMGTGPLELLRVLVANAGGRIGHGWIANSGAEANETALKIVRQKRHPASEIVAFRGGFHGRTTTLAEITDRPDYRRGQPSREVVHYLPFHDRRSPDSPAETLAALRRILRARGEQIAAIVVELVQGEAGFRTAPREYFVPLFEECRRAGVPVWVDEIQTFGRTEELFAFRKLRLEEYVDVVTLGKMLQCAATLFTPELRPDPALLGGTFAGSTVGLAVGRRIVERLLTEGFLGPSGRIAEIARGVELRLERLVGDLGPGRVREFEGAGTLWSLEPAVETHEEIVALVRRCFEAGLLLYYGGSGPWRLRLFVPAIVADDELDEAFDILRACLGE